MKTNFFKRSISVMLAILMLTSVFAVSASAESSNASKSSEEAQKVSWKDKISDSLWEKIEETDKNDKISVWVWFSDIDQDKVESKVKQRTGLSADNIAMEYESAPNDLVKALEEASENTYDKKQRDATAGKLKEYIDETKVQRKQEKEKMETYVKERRNIARDLYVQNNTDLIKKLNLPEKEITFQSQLTPSLIIKLDKSQIISTAKSSSVESIDFYDDSEQVPPLDENQRKTMRVDMARDDFGLTGDGVNVLMNDHGCVRSDASGYNLVSKPDNIKAIVNGTIYPVTNTSVMPGSSSDTHPTFIAATMQAFASDVNIFSVGYGCYADVEWALLNCDINLINGSINYSSFSNYLNDAPAKWFDGLVSTHNVALIASAGNDEGWSSYLWPQVISPSSGYNSIAAGAYHTNGNSSSDTMHDYRYNPTTGTDLVCYKPDIVVAANSTSEASPSLSGVVSMMIQLKPSLAANPELIKAILMASCQRKVKPANGTGAQEQMSDGLTQRQGAGAVDAYRAISIVLQGNYGLGEITSGSTDIDIVQPADGSNINVSLAWLRENSNASNVPSAGTTLGTLQELELSVSQGSNLMGTSAKTNAGKQMVYFPASTQNDQYTIRVTKASQNTESVKYAYAWSTEGTAGKHITFTTNNANGILSREEVEEQLEAAGIGTYETDEPFTATFDETVTGIGDNAFHNCLNLKGVTIRNGITSIGEYAFHGKIEKVIIPDSVTSIGKYAFYLCTNLKEVKLSDNLTSLPVGLFYGCYDLEDVIIPDGVTTIGNYCFGYCHSLENITIPDSVTVINPVAFYSTGLTSVTIPDSVTTIQLGAFQSCNALESVTIGSGVTSIENMAFSNCSNLKDVYFRSLTAPVIESGAFNGIADGARGHIESGAIGYADSYDDLTIVPDTDIRTVYFTNNYNWNNLKAYLWKDGASNNNSWPGVPMTFSHTNYLGQGVFSLTFDYNEYDRIIFNDNGQTQTVNISVGPSGTGYYLTGSKTGEKWDVATFTPDVRTIYFTNNHNWNNLRAYLWKNGTSQNNSWAGVPMTFVRQNSFGEDIYSITLDYTEYDMVIFNNNSEDDQTVNINIGESGTGYYLTGNKDGNKWLVDTYIYQ